MPGVPVPMEGRRVPLLWLVLLRQLEFRELTGPGAADGGSGEDVAGVAEDAANVDCRSRLLRRRLAEAAAARPAAESSPPAAWAWVMGFQTRTRLLMNQ